jgi:hypothetical protein
MTISFVTLMPANGSTYNVARPGVTFNLSSDESGIPITAEYWISTSASPQTDPNAIYASQNYTIESGGFTSAFTLNLELPAGITLTPGTWNIHGRIEYTSSGNVIATKTQAFTIAFTPVATPLSPYSNESRLFVNTASNLLLTWAFNGEAMNNDVQTSYQVIVSRVSDNFTIVDTGKVSSAVTQAVVTIPITYVDVQLSWKVRVWNKWDAPSAYTTGTIFLLGSAFSLNITSPTNNQVLTAGNPNLTVAITISASRTVKAINASAWQGDTKVWEKTVLGNWATGASVVISDTSSVFTNAAYTYRVTAQDNFGSYSTPATRNFSVSYSLPATPSNTPTLVTTNYTTSGYVQIAWNDSTRDTDFYCWAIERKDDLIDPSTDGVVLAGTWTEVGREFGVAASYTFEDYLAPSNYKVTYRIVQIALKFGTEVRSVASTASATVTLVSDAYWLYAGINGDPASIAIKLHNVTADSYTTENESAQFPLLSRGRYNERGTKLGVTGSLTCQLRDSGGTPARLKRMLLDDFVDVFPVARLRNPFGDTYLVALGNVGVEHIAGTGRSEFTNVTIPYAEVVS